MHQWEDKLAELRQVAPNEDRVWLQRHAKRCPRCKAHIEVGWWLGRSGAGADRRRVERRSWIPEGSTGSTGA